jgi:cyclohexadieny/prephenate dehydrogenase
MTDSAPLFQKISLIGIGLIGSSLAHGIRRGGLAGKIICGDQNADHVALALTHKIVDEATTDLGAAVRDADLVILCVPVGAYASVMEIIAPHLKQGAILSDVGSVKQASLRDVMPYLPDGVAFVPGHPIAGTEHSGPLSGFAELFQDRWCLLTPPPGTPTEAVDAVAALWRGCNAAVEVMDPAHHDKILAITSHLPHLIAYTIVGTASDMNAETQAEVVRYSASGFRDFTRIAASDPTMWRDIFLNNRDSVLEMLQRFTEDLTALQRAIRWGDGDMLFKFFTHTRAIRRGIIDARQHVPEDQKIKSTEGSKP